MFGRRRGRRDDEADLELEQDYDEYPEDDDEPAGVDDDAEDEPDPPEPASDGIVSSGGPGTGAPRPDGGPWDAGEPYPAMDRVDLGSLHVPVGHGYDIQLVFAEQHGAWVTVHTDSGDLQLQAFAAPRKGSLWDEVRAEIIGEITSAGGVSEEQEGPFGAELLASVPAEPSNAAAGLHPARFVGVDGPRWFLRGLFSGPAAQDQAAAAELEELMRQVVVVRGDHPVPPRDLLELRLPEQAQQALAQEQARLAQEGEGGFQADLNPFERGPEITETR